MSEPEVNTPKAVPLYTHQARPEWGLAILAWSRGPRRAYQFEDGELRVFRKGYYELLEEVDAPIDRARNVTRTLERALGREEARASGAKVPDTSFDDQMRILTIQYEGGFTDPKWLSGRRGQGKKRRAKKHRDRAIAEAQERLAETAFDRAVDSAEYRVMAQAVADVLKATDLLTKKQLAPLLDVAEGRQRSLVMTLGEALHGVGPYAPRFERLVATLSLITAKGPNWQMATALQALVHPDEHVCVRPSAFRKHAAWMAPRLTFVNTPNASLYGRLLSMANTTRDKLVAAGHEPTDLWDVYDFITQTRRHSAKKLLEH